ncbi:hypothetical protein KVA01_11100 [Kocuria varians]|uniref:Uncharacterized protein n=1 Tax=Kocuria varians TaxID=1272 RepID=A0A4Y4D1A0_KOCVA|nr:hypothetical protein KVA01_11100 [Kocuria varians]
MPNGATFDAAYAGAFEAAAITGTDHSAPFTSIRRVAACDGAVEDLQPASRRADGAEGAPAPEAFFS